MGADQIFFEQVAWQRGDLPVSEMRRRLARRLATQMAVLERWAAQPVVVLPAPEPVVVAPPAPPRPPRFHIPAPPPRPEPAVPLETVQALLLERLGWFVGGFLVVAGAVFLLGTVWKWLSPMLRVAAEQGLLVAAAAGLGLGGAWLVRRQLPAGRALAAVGLALSAVVSVPTGVEGPSLAGFVGMGLGALGALGVARVAGRAGLGPLPPALWALGVTLPALAWLVPALSWPVVLAGAGLGLVLVRQSLFGPPHPSRLPTLAAWGAVLGAALLAVLPELGPSVGWSLAALTGGVLLWVDEARARWRGLSEPSFSRPLPLVGLSLALGALAGLLGASAGEGAQALFGGLLGLLLVWLVAVAHGLPWLVRVATLGSLLVPAALATVLGLGGGGVLSGWFLTALVAVPALLAALPRLQEPLQRPVVDVMLAVALLSSAIPLDGGPGGVLLWAALALGLAMRWGRQDGLWVGHTLLAVAVLAAVTDWRGDIGQLASGWALLSLGAEAVGRSVRARTRDADHEAGRLGLTWAQIAPVQALLATLLLVPARLLEPTVSLVVAGPLLGLVWWLVGSRLREQAVGLILLVPLGVAASCIRPLLGLPSEPSTGLAVGTVVLLVAGALASRDRGPFTVLGTRFRVAGGDPDEGEGEGEGEGESVVAVDGRGPVGWLASPLWRVGQLGWLVIAGVGLAGALGLAPLAEPRVLGLALAVALAGALAVRLDRRASPEGLPAKALALGAWWVVAAELALLAQHRGAPSWALGALLALTALALVTRPSALTQGAAMGLCAGAVVLGSDAQLQREAMASLPWFAAAAPLVVLAVRWRQVLFSWTALALVAAGVGSLLARELEGHRELGWAMATLGLAGVALGAAMERWLPARWGPGLLDVPVRAAAVGCVAVSGLLWGELSLPGLADAGWPAGRAMTLAAWLLCAALSRERWLKALAGVAAGVELLLGAHGLGRAWMPELPELGATTLAALGALGAASLGLGGASPAGRWLLLEIVGVGQNEPAPAPLSGASWWKALLGALVPLGVVPVAFAACAPLLDPNELHALPIVLIWGLAASWALGASWPAMVAWGALLVAVLPQGGVAFAAMAAGSAWTASILRRFPERESEQKQLARAVAWQVLVPGAVLAAAAAFALGAWHHERLGPTAALVALTALGLVHGPDRPRVITLAPALVALFARAPLPLVAGLLAAGSFALGMWEARARPRSLASQGAASVGALAAVGAVAAGRLDSAYLALLLLALTGTLALSVARQRTELEFTVTMIAASLALSVGASRELGMASLGACLMAVAIGGRLVSAGTQIPFRAAPAFWGLGTLMALLAAPSHRALALVALLAGLLWSAASYPRRPTLASALQLGVALLAALVGLRLGHPLSQLDAALWIGLGGALVATADAAARFPSGQPLAQVSRATAAAAPLVGLVLAALVSGLPSPSVWVGAAASLGLLYARFRDPPALVLALLAADMAFACALLQSGSLDPTLYVLPFALSLGGLSHLWRTRLPSPAVHALRWSAAGLLYATALAQLLTDAHSALLLVMVSLIGLAAGALLQVRAWIWSGTAFLVAVVAMQGARFGIEHQLGLGVLLSLAGVLVLGAMVAGALLRPRSLAAPEVDDIS